VTLARGPLHRLAPVVRKAAVAAICLAACRGPGEPARKAPPAPSQTTGPRPVAAAAVRELKPGRSEPGRLSGPGPVVYRIALGPGELLHAILEQQGVDLVVALRDPAGRELLALDSPAGDRSPEHLFFVGERGGSYLLEVRPIADVRDGRFALRAETRPATAMDRIRARACASTSRADAAMAGDAAALREAVRWYGAALAGWRRSREVYQEALGEARLAKALWRLGEARPATRHWERALSLVQGLGLESPEPMLRNQLGLAYARLGQGDRARSSYERALAGARRLGDRYEATAAINNLGLLEKEAGEPWKALLLLEEALAGWREQRFARGAAAALHNLGALYTVLDQLPEAQQCLEEALGLYRTAGTRRDEAATTMALGWVRFRRGDVSGGRQDLLRALALRRETDDRRGEAVTLDRLGTVSREIRELDRSVSEYRQALALFAELDDRQGSALTMSNLGETLTLRGDPAAGLQHQNLALEVLEGQGQPSAEAYALSRRAGARRALGDLEAAWADMRQAVLKLEGIRDRAESGDLRIAYHESVHEQYELAVDLLMDLHAEKPDQGYQRLALDISERARARGLLDLVREARGQRLAKGGGDLHRLEEEIRAAERRHAALLAEGGPEAVLAAEEARVRRLVRERDKTLVELRLARGRRSLSARPLGTAQIQRRLLEPGTVLLVYFLGKERSFVWAVDDREVESAVLPRRELVEGAALRLHGLLARSQREGVEDQLRLTAEELSAVLLGGVAHRLRQAERIIVVVSGALAYVPFAALPHPAEGGQPLIARHEVVEVPSASVLAAIRERAAARSLPPGLVAVVADPVFHRDDPRLAPPGAGGAKRIVLASAGPPPGGAVTRSARDLGVRSLARLPFSRREAQAILALAGPRQGFSVMDSAANLELVTSGRLEGFRIVHFATHALIHPRYPELSGVVLSLVDARGRPRPGFLRPYQIFSLRLPAELVVLSGCRTGLGVGLDGEGLVGLTQSFFHAGASRVLVSLWDVDDEATARLMERFYRELLGAGRSPAAALRAAQLSMREDPRWSAPYYWAGFVLQGDPRASR
jgi:CHAT domain-containing protein